MREYFEIEIPVLKNIKLSCYEYDWTKSEFDAMNDLIANSGNISIPIWDDLNIKPRFSFVNSMDLDQKKLHEEHRIPNTFRTHHLLVGRFEYDLNTLQDIFIGIFEGCDGLTEEELKSTIIKLIIENVEKVIYYLFIVLSIAQPGKITFDKSIIKINEGIQYLNQTFKSFGIQQAINSARDIKWPLIHELEISKVSKWLFKRNSFISGKGDNQVDRALIAYINTFYYDDIPLKLMYSMQALEILYSFKSDSIVESLNNNTEIYLGERIDFKKTIKTMYQIRSKFIHGSMNNSSLYYPCEEDSEIDVALELNKAVDISLSVLIATIQKLIIDDRNSLMFEKYYKLAD